MTPVALCGRASGSLAPSASAKETRRVFAGGACVSWAYASACFGVSEAPGEPVHDEGGDGNEPDRHGEHPAAPASSRPSSRSGRSAAADLRVSACGACVSERMGS